MTFSVWGNGACRVPCQVAIIVYITRCNIAIAMQRNSLRKLENIRSRKIDINIQTNKTFSPPPIPAPPPPTGVSKIVITVIRDSWSRVGPTYSLVVPAPAFGLRRESNGQRLVMLDFPARSLVTHAFRVTKRELREIRRRDRETGKRTTD